MGFKSLLASLLLVSAATAQLTGHVGPTTALSAKQATICSVLDYGGAVGSADIGPAISSAFTVSVCRLIFFMSLTMCIELCAQALGVHPLCACRYVCIRTCGCDRPD